LVSTNTPNSYSGRPTAIVSQYQQYECSGIEVPARYTSMKCYWIDNPYSSFGWVYYDGDKIGAVGSFTKGSEKLSQQASDFIIYWATAGGWDQNDLQDAFLGMKDMQFSDTKVFGDLNMTIDYNPEGEYLAIWVGLR
jgi:hypothetical protein